MLASVEETPFDRPNWIFEEKYDGVRLLAYKEGERVSLFTRNSIERSARYPEIATAMLGLKAKTLCIDGEAVVLDAKKVSRFQLLQRRKGRHQFVVFDCLFANGRDLRKEPLSERRLVLEKFVAPTSTLLLSNRLLGGGLKAFQAASRRGLEGIVGKNLASTYSETRSSQWVKIKVHQTDEFIIGGFTAPAGSRSHFGALLLGIYLKDQLVYAGKVGTGFDERTLASLYATFQKLIRSKSPFHTPVQERNVTYLAPKLVAQVSYSELTTDGKLRHPVYLGLRDDKAPDEVRKET